MCFSKVTGKNESGSRRKSFNLRINPCGEWNEESNVEVSGEFYENTRKGDSVFVIVQKGFIGVPWFYIGNPPVFADNPQETP